MIEFTVNRYVVNGCTFYINIYYGLKITIKTIIGIKEKI